MKKFARPILWTIFLIYCFVLVYVLFLSRGTRVGFTYAEYMRRFTNFIPFKTIIEYVQRYSDGYWRLATLNLLGNLALFVPMGMALPCLSKKLNRFWKVTITVLGMVFLVEIAQGLMRVGSIDIDDVIFNVVGAMIGYGIIAIPFIKTILVKINFISDRGAIQA